MTIECKDVQELMFKFSLLALPHFRCCMFFFFVFFFSIFTFLIVISLLFGSQIHVFGASIVLVTTRDVLGFASVTSDPCPAKSTSVFVFG